MCKGGSGNTSTTAGTSSIPPEVAQNYRDIFARANTAASQPLQQYGGQRVADMTPDQQAAFDSIRGAQSTSQQYFDDAGGLARSSAQGVYGQVPQYNQQAIDQYMSPYTDEVVNASLANLREGQGQQREALTGNAIAAGAFGGDRAGVAQGELARQQGLAQGQLTANLRNQAFTNAQGQLNTQQNLAANVLGADQARQAQAAQLLGGLGQADLNAQLTGAGAQLQAGGLQQQQQQSGLDTAYQDFMTQQAYPFQTTSWLANIGLGTGGAQGGGQTSTTTAPNASAASQAAGLGLTALAGYGIGSSAGWWKSGGRVHRASGGLVGDDWGDDPYSDDEEDPLAGYQDITDIGQLNAMRAARGLIPSMADPDVMSAAPASAASGAPEVRLPGFDGAMPNDIESQIAGFGQAAAPAVRTPISRPERSGFDRALDSPWAALAAAGLGMAAGTSPNALANVGKGGLAGLEFAAGQGKTRQTRDYQDRTLEDRGLTRDAAERARTESANRPTINSSGETVSLIYPGGKIVDTGIPTAAWKRNEQTKDAQTETQRIARERLKLDEKKANAEDKVLVPIYDPNSASGITMTPRSDAAGKPGAPQGGLKFTQGPDGSFELVQGPGAGGPAGFSKPTVNKIDEELVSNAARQTRLYDIAAGFKPEYLTHSGRLQNWGAGEIEKLAPGLIGDDTKKQMGEFTVFRQRAFDDLNQTLKEMSGAAITPQEAERLLKVLGDPSNDSPTQFKAKLDEVTRKVRLSQARLMYLRKEGPEGAAKMARVSLESMPSIIKKREEELVQKAKAEQPDADDTAIKAIVRPALQQEFGI